MVSEGALQSGRSDWMKQIELGFDIGLFCRTKNLELLKEVVGASLL